MTAGGPDLFVVCKNCGAEVSPYITECPYCGQRLRKRAPKLDRDGRIAERPERRHAHVSLPRLRRGEIPGIRHEARPYASLSLVLLGVVGCLIWRTSAVSLGQLTVFGGELGTRFWHVFTAASVYDNTGYAFVALGTIALFGVLVERRYGSVVVVALALIGGAGGLALAAHLGGGAYLGGNGAALALLCAWAVPDLTRLAQHRDYEGDLIGAGVLAGVNILMPLAAPLASWAAAGVGVVAGLLLGYLLTRIHS